MKNKNMRLKGQLRMYMQWPLIMTILLLAMNIWMYMTDQKAGLTMTVFVIIYAVIVGLLYFYNRSLILADLIQFSTQYKGIQNTLLKELTVPYAIILEDGHILWKNDRFSEIVDGREKFIQKIIPELNKGIFPKDDETRNELEITYKERDYQVELRPTYRLLIGIPGKSNAFAISGKLGLPDYIIEDAKTRLSEQDVSFEDLISDLETSKRTIEKEQEEIAAYKKEIEALKSQAQQKQERIEEQRERILAEAREKANTILRDAKDVADETIKNFRKFGKENISAAEMEKERERLRKKMKENTASSSLKVQKPKKEYKPTDFKLGESVKVLSMNLTGTISSLPDSRGNVTVQMGILRSQVHISDLEIIEEANPYAPKSFKRTSKGRLKMSKSLSVSPEINLLGKTVDEAVSELDKYLDDALLSHLSTVRVVHGKGTGALRKGIHEFLRRQKHVKSYRLGEFGEGDAGVTIVELK